MAQFNITLNQDEILQLLASDRNTAFVKLLQDSLNSILKAESTEQLKAEPYERTEERTGFQSPPSQKPARSSMRRLGNSEKDRFPASIRS